MGENGTSGLRLVHSTPNIEDDERNIKFYMRKAEQLAIASCESSNVEWELMDEEEKQVLMLKSFRILYHLEDDFFSLGY